jgi:hypothetical protein
MGSKRLLEARERHTQFLVSLGLGPWPRTRRQLRGTDFPNLKVEERTSPCTCLFGKTPGKRKLPADAKRFPVGHSHKQGMVMLTPGSDPKDFGGNKT